MNRKRLFVMVMNRKRLFIVAASLVATCAVLLLQTLGVFGIGTVKDFSTIGRGYHSGIRLAAYYVVGKESDWVQLWKNHTSARLPEVNFSRKVVIAVFMGLFTQYTYEIEIKRIVDTGLSIVVEVEKIYNPGGPDAFCTPFHIVEVDKLDKGIIFKTWSIYL